MLVPNLIPRSVLEFPPGFEGNASDTTIGGKHFNVTTLRYWNYTLYTNDTLSNGSDCKLAFGGFVPDYLFPNGSFTNSTSCYHAYYGIGTRGGIGLGFAVAFAFALIAVLVNLGKHGKLHLPAEKRFYPVGRRWQWYWAIFVCATALVSLLTNVDVDRYYLPELPIVLTSFFWFLMQQGTMALVWEAVRHWGSWMERQFIDPNPFSLREDDARAKVELLLPLFFYLCLWLNFFLVVPRSWTAIEHQRYPDQIRTDAMPTATDARFKAAAFCLVVCWLTTVFSLRHSIQHYRSRNRGLVRRALGLVRATPWRFTLLLPVALVVPAFQALVAWRFAYSPLNVQGDRAAMYVGGYAPALLVLLLNCAHGFATPNEDHDLMAQRRHRGSALDREMGLVPRPSWWKRLRADHVAPDASVRDRIASNVRELAGGQPTPKDLDPSDGLDHDRDHDHDGAAPAYVVEMMTPLPADRSDKRRGETTLDTAAALLFPRGTVPSAMATTTTTTHDTDPPPYADADVGASRGRQATSNRPPGSVAGSGNASAATTDSPGRPQQQIRSMLDV